MSNINVSIESLKRLLFCLFFLGNFSYGQNLGLDWIDQDGGTGTVTVSKIITDQNGNAFVYGNFTGTADFDPDPSSSSFLNSNGGKDMFIQKLDPNGQLLWVHSFGSTGDDVIYGMCLDNSENVIVTGLHWNTVDFDPGPGVANISSSGAESAFTLKLDVNGDFMWVIQNAVGSGLSVGHGVVCDGSDNLYVTGQYRGNVDLDPDPGNTLTVSSNGGRDVFVQKLDAIGGLIWSIHYGASADDTPTDIQLDPNNDDVIVLGIFRNTVDFDPGTGVTNLTSNGNGDVYFQKIDNNGNFIWVRSFGGINEDYASEIKIDAGSKIYLGGWYSGSVDFDPGAGVLSLTSAGNYDGYFSSYDDQGSLLWLNTIGDSGNDRVYSIKLDVMGNLFSTGSFENTVDFDPSIATDLRTSNGLADIFIQKVNASTGSYLWTETLGGSDNDVGSSITTDVNDKLYLTGRFGTTVDFDPETSVYNLTTAGGYDGFVEKFMDPIAEPPSLGNETMTLNEDDPTTISPSLTSNNIDPDGTSTTVTSVLSTSGGGTLVIATGDTTIAYTPAPDFNGVDTVIYEVCDGGAPTIDCITDTLFVVVNPVNDAPSQGNETMTVNEDDPTTTSPILTSNNIDPDGSTTLVTTIVSSSGNSVVTISGGGTTLEYTPAADFNGVDTVLYEVCDGGIPLPSICVIDTLFVTVNPVNDAPSQGNETMTINEDDPTTTSPILTSNNVDPDGTTTIVTTIIGISGNGVVTITGGGTSVNYTPAPDFNGVDTVVYEVCDGGVPLPASCVIDTLFIIVNPVSDMPTQGNETMTVNEDDPSTTSTNLTSNNIDPDGTSTSVTSVISSSGGGSISITNGGTTVDYTPAADFNGVDTVIYEVCDGGTPTIDCVVDTLFITVLPVNDAASQGNETMTIYEDDPATTSPMLTSNNVDPDGTSTSVTSIISSSGGGVITINGSGTTIDYTPAANFYGVDTVVYQVCDGGTPLPSSCVIDTLFITVLPVNDPPVTDNETIQVDVDSIESGDLTDTGDYDIDGNLVVNVNPVYGPSNGVIVINSDGSFTYSPNVGFVGQDTIVVEVCDDGTPLPALCTMDTIFVSISGCSDSIGYMDCDNDGLTNDEELTGVDDPNTLANPSGETSDPNNPDSDGDGVVDGTEAIDGTSPTDPCDYNSESITLPAITNVLCELSIPEAFSPNGDGVNDLFVIDGIENYTTASLLVLNRWGNKVFSSDQYENDWDGTNQFGLTTGGNTLPMGTYFYLLTLTTSGQSTPNVIKGYVYIAR